MEQSQLVPYEQFMYDVPRFVWVICARPIKSGYMDQEILNFGIGMSIKQELNVACLKKLCVSVNGC